MRLRKAASLLLALVFMLGILAGCGGGAKESEQSTPATEQPSGQAGGGQEAAPADPTQIQAEITVWGWAPWDKSFESILPEFNKKYPGIKVNVEIMSYDEQHTKLLAALAAGDGAPDVAGIEIAYINAFALKGGLVDLLREPYNAGQLKNDMVEYKWIQATTPDGRLIALPWDIGPATLFYRRDVLEKAGLPSDPDQVAQLLSTWDGYIDAGQKIKAATGAFMIANPMDIFSIYFNHKDMFDADWNVAVDGPMGQKALNVARKVRGAGIDARIGTWSAEWQAALNEGQIATLIGGSWMGGLLKTWIDTDGEGVWGVVPIPEDPGQNWGGSFLAIPEQSKNKLAAWKFIEFALATREAQNAIMRSTDIFPAYIPAWDDPLYDEPDPYFAGQNTRRLWIEVTRKIPPLITTPMDPVAEPTLMQVASQCIEEGTGTNACLATAKAEIESKIAQDKKIALEMKARGKGQ